MIIYDKLYCAELSFELIVILPEKEDRIYTLSKSNLLKIDIAQRE